MAEKDIFTTSRLSGRIITNTIDYLSEKDANLRATIIYNIKLLAKHYKITLRSKPRESDNDTIREDLKAFILNSDGYNNNIPNLYNSLKNDKQ